MADVANMIQIKKTKHPPPPRLFFSLEGMAAKTLEPKRLKSINIRLPSDKEYYTKVLSSSLTV